jgi:hypothetical protein
MRRATEILLVLAFAVATSSAVRASSVCAYVNDNVDGHNTAEGYKIGPGTAVAHVGPYRTNGSGTNDAFYAGGLGAIRVQGNDLYVNDAGTNNITHFIINTTDCTLTKDPTLYPTGENEVAFGDPLAVTPDGAAMFVAGVQHIYSHTIASNGSLGQAVTEVSNPSQPVGFQVSPDGSALIVSYINGLEVCAYPISNGHLGAANCQPTVGYPAGISVDSNSACVYAAESTINGPTEVAAFTLSVGILGPATEYASFGPGVSSEGILVSHNNKAIYVTDEGSAQVTLGRVSSGCTLTYESIIRDGVSGNDTPGQVAQAATVPGYVVTGDADSSGNPHMGIFKASPNGRIEPVGSGQYRLRAGNDAPLTVVVLGVQ